jgi:hypothetical protein
MSNPHSFAKWERCYSMMLVERGWLDRVTDAYDKRIRRESANMYRRLAIDAWRCVG